ncbi:MAG: glycosyltransferase family 2 protein [Arhodomonas sp.]|nr:glycosyltransferase family 2 protein [Arhodomonas sp.]
MGSDAGAMLADCVGALLESRLPVEVIVVDNASDDDSLDTLVQRFDGTPRLRVIHRRDNGGFAVAVNRGLREARADWVAVVNPDCIVRPDTLGRLLDGGDTAGVGMVGGLLLNPDGTEQRGCRRHLPTPCNALARVLGLHRLFARRWDFNLTGTPLPAEPVPVRAISGALMLVRRSAWQAVGTLDEGYFLHCEDLDWCRRFREQGWGIRFVPGAVAVHHQGVCSRRNRCVCSGTNIAGWSAISASSTAAGRPWHW